MTITKRFDKFHSNLQIDAATAKKIAERKNEITKRVNIDFRASHSNTNYSFYGGSFGRGTNIKVSDIDLLIELPNATYHQYNNRTGNKQSALLQALKNSICKRYTTTHIRGDGQVVQLNFFDNISFEILPCFINSNGITFTFPDTNNGGSWKVTDPKSEISELTCQNKNWNRNLKKLCRMARAWRSKWNVPIGGLLIDTLAYNFLNKWKYRNKTSLYHDWMTRDFFGYLKSCNSTQKYWLAPGSNQQVHRNGNFEYKASLCHNIALKALECERNNQRHSANREWQNIYGTKFPS